MMAHTKYTLQVVALSVSVLAATNSTSNCTGNNATALNLRYPPTVEDSGDWEAPPKNWNVGHWFVSYTSFPDYQLLWNFENDIYPLFPTTEEQVSLQQNLDLATYMTAATGNSTLDNYIYTAFGLDTPAPDVGSGVYNFSGQGAWHLTNYYMFIAWGYDTNGDGYFVEYETPVEEGGDGDISVVSRVQGGPSQETTEALFAAMNSTFAGEERANLGEYARGLQKIHFDNRRDGLDIVPCNQSCVENAWMANV